jgi:hypothetical protein
MVGVAQIWLLRSAKSKPGRNASLPEKREPGDKSQEERKILLIDITEVTSVVYILCEANQSLTSSYGRRHINRFWRFID